MTRPSPPLPVRASRNVDGQIDAATYPTRRQTPYATGLSTPAAMSTAAATQRTAFSATRPTPSAANRWRAVSIPRTIPITAAPRVTAPTSSGNHAAPESKRRSRTVQDAPPATTATARLTSAMPGSGSRTERSPPWAETERAIQCWSGKVRAAPAKDQ